MAKKREWTTEEEATLFKMMNNSYTQEKMAIHFKTTRGTIRKKLVSLGYKKQIKTNQYFYNVGDIVNGVKIINQTRVGKGSYKGYTVQSIKYPNAPQYTMYEESLKKGCYDAYSSTPVKRVFEGNSLWSVEEIRKYIVNKEEAKKIAPHNSNVKVDVRCNSCGRVKKMAPSKLVDRGFSCQICNKGYYPELFFGAYNEVLELNFIPQQRFDNFQDYIFDFVNYEKRIIVETHGIQHYNKKSEWYKRTHKSDTEKRKYCKENGWIFIELDCSTSSFEYIKKSIENEELLLNIKGDDISKIIKVIEENKTYPVKKIVKLYTEDNLTTSKIGEIFGIDRQIIAKILKRSNIKLRHGKRLVRCITTDKVFKSGAEAERFYGVARSTIHVACNPTKSKKHAGIHPITGEKLTWEYVD